MMIFWHFEITLLQVTKTSSRLIFLKVLLTEALLEPKNSFQLLLSADIQLVECGDFGKCQNFLALMALWHFQHPTTHAPILWDFVIFDEFRDFRGFPRFLEQYIVMTAWCATAAGITDDHGWLKMLVVKDSIKNKNIFRVEKNLKICFEKNSEHPNCYLENHEIPPNRSMCSGMLEMPKSISAKKFWHFPMSPHSTSWISALRRS